MNNKKRKRKKYNPISGIIISIINILWEIEYGDIVNAIIISFSSLSYIHKEREEMEEGERERGKKKKTTTTKISLFGSKLSTQLFLNAFSLIPCIQEYPS